MAPLGIGMSLGGTAIWGSSFIVENTIFCPCQITTTTYTNALGDSVTLYCCSCLAGAPCQGPVNPFSSDISLMPYHESDGTTQNTATPVDGTETWEWDGNQDAMPREASEVSDEGTWDIDGNGDVQPIDPSDWGEEL